MVPTSTDLTTLISNFSALYRPLTLRRTEDSLWFGDKILSLPAIHRRDIDVAFPTQYRNALNDMTRRIADEVDHSVDQGSLKTKMNTFYKTMTRQQLLASAIPWLVNFWSGTRANQEEHFLAASCPQEHLDKNQNWLPTNPFWAMGLIYTGEIPLPSCKVLFRG